SPSPDPITASGDRSRPRSRSGISMDRSAQGSGMRRLAAENPVSADILAAKDTPRSDANQIAPGGTRGQGTPPPTKRPAPSTTHPHTPVSVRLPASGLVSGDPRS